MEDYTYKLQDRMDIMNSDYKINILKYIRQGK